MIATAAADLLCSFSDVIAYVPMEKSEKPDSKALLAKEVVDGDDAALFTRKRTTSFRGVGAKSKRRMPISCSKFDQAAEGSEDYWYYDYFEQISEASVLRHR